jgi:Tfp pilus assembly protein PilN
MTPPGTAADTAVAPVTPEESPAWLQHRAASVDLLPAEVVEARRLRTTRKVLAGGLLALLLVVAVAFLAIRSGVGAAEADLVAAQAETAALQQQKARYDEVVVVEGQVERIRQAQRQVMAGDVLWSPLLDTISATYPEGLWLTSLSVTTDPTTVATGVPALPADPLAEPTVAKIAFSGNGGDLTHVAAWLDGLTAVPGLSDARYSVAGRSEISGQTVTEFTSDVGVTADALSHRFDDGAAR